MTAHFTDAGALLCRTGCGRVHRPADDALGLTLTSDSLATVTVSEDAAEGQAIFFSAAASE
ncbi:MAG: hypothetical protein R2856_14660 [Caldilineaceae bacterium]